MEIATLIAGLPIHVGRGFDSAASVMGVTEDSRLAAPGWVFVARPGLRADGRAYAAEAVRAGALAVLSDVPVSGVPTGATLLTPDPAMVGAVLAERFHGSPSSRLALVGVTGTNGKTTIAHLVHRTLNALDVRCGLIGTVEVDRGEGPEASGFTTPPAERVSGLLAAMVSRGCRAAVMEVSSHALDQGRCAGLHFGVGVFTNLTGDHLDYHKTMERYGAAKARLFTSLSSDAVAIVNAEDPWSAVMAARCRARVLGCALDAPTGVPTSCVGRVGECGAAGTVLALEGPWGGASVRTRLIGRHNAMNLLQAFASCVLVSGAAPEAVARAIGGVDAPRGRLEPVHAPGDRLRVLVDYAHTDDGLVNALRAARGSMARDARLWVVFGCGGDRDRSKRPRMGSAASTLADVAVVTSDNPRTERPGAIIDEILAGIGPDRRAACIVEPDRAAAIRRAIEGASPGDTVLIAGKGHEQEQILSDASGGVRRVPFDDASVARAALEGLRRPGRAAQGSRA